LDSVPDAPDVQTRYEEKQIELARLRAELDSVNQDMAERKKYAGHVFWMCACWLSAILLLLIASGIGVHFKLSDKVLLAAIGSTTTNILGVFYIVARYLFPKK